VTRRHLLEVLARAVGARACCRILAVRRKQKAKPRQGSRVLKMQYAGGLVKHLGLSMYRGAVPAIAELISNAWDADAKRVDIAIPLGVGMRDQQITVSDDGVGMDWDDVQGAYLVVGRDRRKAQGGERTSSGRLVMGRKGLGKLAGFGIARVVEIRTVRKGWLTHFSMDFEKMTKGGEARMVEHYQPTVLADRAVKEPNGTCVSLRVLQITRPIEEDEFRQSMSRRFSVLGKGFDVRVNSLAIPTYAPAVQFEFAGPNDGWEDVPGLGAVEWWFGFTEKPIQTESARGISILVREKMAQAPFFFDLSGGAYGQAGMQYMTGEVYADQLDQEKDSIGTDRQGIVWSDPQPQALLKWGEAKVRERLREWAALRHQANERELTRTLVDLDQSVEDRISRLRPVEQHEAREVIRKLASIESVTDKPERARELLDLILRAFEDSSFFALIKALGDADQTERDAVLKLVTELDVFETVKMAEVVRARIAVIRKFREMVEQDVPEKPDMQDFLFGHPWLIEPEWQLVEHEKELETLLVEHFKLDRTADPDSGKRVDFFCVSTRGRFLVVEVKRPSETIGRAEISQIIDYVTFLAQRAPGESGRPHFYEGILVGHHVSPDAGERWRTVAEKSNVTVRRWTELLAIAERIHRDFLDAVKQRAPQDARVQSLPAIDATATPSEEA
jgi:RecB family endonuclease NucS